MPKDIASLRQERAAAYEALVALGHPSNDDEQAAFDTAESNVIRLDTQIKAAERVQALKSSTAIISPAAPAIITGDQQLGDDKRFGTFGEMLVAVASASNSNSGAQRDPRLQWQTFNAAAGQSEGVGADGGFLVQQDFASELFKLAHDSAVLAPRTRRIPVGRNSNGLRLNAIKESSRATGSRYGGVRAFWTAEGETKTDSKLKLRQMDLKLHKLAGVGYATDELLEDAVAMEAVMKDAFAEEFAFVIDDSIFEGDGAGKPFGIMNSGALITVPKETSQAADTITVENIVKMWARMWSRSRSNAIWTINQQVEPQLYTMKIGDTPIYLPNGTIAGSPYATLMGRPVVPTEFNSALGDKGDIVLMDLSQYLMIEKGGLKQDMSIHVRFLQDESTFRFVLRLDGQPIWDTALTPFKGTDTLSPFVTLAERA